MPSIPYEDIASDQFLTKRTNVRFRSSVSSMALLTPAAVDRQGFHLKVTPCHSWNDNALGLSVTWGKFLSLSGTICTGAAADLVGYELRSKLAQRWSRQTCSKTQGKTDTAIWGVKCK